MLTINDEFLDQVRHLPLASKQRLLDLLIAEIDQPDPGIDAAWLAEAKRRDQAYENGALAGHSFRDVFGEDL